MRRQLTRAIASSSSRAATHQFASSSQSTLYSSSSSSHTSAANRAASSLFFRRGGKKWLLADAPSPTSSSSSSSAASYFASRRLFLTSAPAKTIPLKRQYSSSAMKAMYRNRWNSATKSVPHSVRALHLATKTTHKAAIARKSALTPQTISNANFALRFAQRKMYTSINGKTAVKRNTKSGISSSNSNSGLSLIHI